jgi:hypothetical protein
MKFFPGIPDIHHVKNMDRSFISVNRLLRRKSDFVGGDWIMDSGAFTQITQHGDFVLSVEAYAAQIIRWSRCGNMLAAVAQDYMCEDFVVAKTGLTKTDHQRMTIERYDQLRAAVPSDIYIMPVLQGYAPEDYAAHVKAYGDRLKPGMWVGVGSICKRNSNAHTIEAVLKAILAVRPDLRLHGFGIKITALQSTYVYDSLYSADSMAWSFNARKNGRNANDWREAVKFANKINKQHRQIPLFL